MLTLQPVTALLLIMSACAAGDFDSADGHTISVLHSLDMAPEAVFTSRGVISLRGLRGGGSATYQPTGSLSDVELAQLQTLVQNDGLYRLKLTTQATEGREIEVATFIKACQLVEAGLRHTLQLTVDPAGSLTAASVVTDVGQCRGGPAAAAVTLSDVLTADVQIRQTEVGPIPDTATFIQKIKEEKIAKQRGETKDNRSFIAKYWMYIVPAVLLLMVTGGSEPAAAGGGR